MSCVVSFMHVETALFSRNSVGKKDKQGGNYMNKGTKEATNEMTKEKGRKDGNREVANILREFFIERRDEVRRVTELDFTWESQEELNRIEHKADAVCELLEDLGEIPQELQDEIYAERDLEVLSKMHKLAAKAKSIEDFQAKLEEMKCCM